MIVTEQEAATKWCPHARYALDRNAASNRWRQDAPAEEPHAVNPVPCRCIGSRCMAWRWEYDCDDGGRIVRTDRGRCGLAGPQ